MVARPQDAYIGDNARTEGEAKTWLELLRDNMAEAPAGAVETELTINGSKQVTPTGAFHSIDTGGDAATDVLTEALQTNHPEGRVLFLRQNNPGRVVEVQHGTMSAGGFTMMDGQDLDLSTVEGYAGFIRRGNTWVEFLRGMSPSGLADAVGAVQFLNTVPPNASGVLTLAVSNTITKAENPGTNTLTIGESHSALTNNPHAVTATQVGKDTAQWNANKIQGKSVNIAARANGTVLQFHSGDDEYKHVAPPSGAQTAPTGYLRYDGVANAILNRSNAGILVSKGGTGRYTITWPGGMFADANYFVLALAGTRAASGVFDDPCFVSFVRGKTTTQLGILLRSTSGAAVDTYELVVAAYSVADWPVV